MSPEELAALVEHGYCSPHQPSVLSWRGVGKIADAREDLVGGLGPHERLGPALGDLDIATDGRFQLARAPMDAAAELLFGERRGPPLDEIDPRRARSA
jgi:hypothetical protein